MRRIFVKAGIKKAPGEYKNPPEPSHRQLQGTFSEKHRCIRLYTFTLIRFDEVLEGHLLSWSWLGNWTISKEEVKDGGFPPHPHGWFGFSVFSLLGFVKNEDLTPIPPNCRNWTICISIPGRTFLVRGITGKDRWSPFFTFFIFEREEGRQGRSFIPYWVILYRLPNSISDSLPYILFCFRPRCFMQSPAMLLPWPSKYHLSGVYFFIGLCLQKIQKLFIRKRIFLLFSSITHTTTSSDCLSLSLISPEFFHVFEGLFISYGGHVGVSAVPRAVWHSCPSTGPSWHRRSRPRMPAESGHPEYDNST